MVSILRLKLGVAELVDAAVLGADVVRRVGSSPITSKSCKYYPAMPLVYFLVR